MTVSDTAGMIRAIDSLSVEACDVWCWCQLPNPSDTKSRMRWFPGEPILRFPLEEAA
jgi:hypothetical protein